MVSVAGEYTIIVSNDECADDTAIVNLYTVPMPLADITVDGPTAFCEGLSTWLKLPYKDGYEYQWYKDGQPLAFANGVVYEASLQGSYHATVTHHHCTTISKKIDITVYPLPVPVITRRETVLNTGIYTSYQWSIGGWEIAGATKQSHQLVQPGYYTVKVTDSNGCPGISAPFDVVSTEEGCIVRLPSAFSPNNDDKNDVFRLIGLGDFELKELLVLNRWGQVVFSTTNGRAGWDGTYNGTAQEVGTYFYMVRYKCDNETQPRLRKGDVILTR
jgi:gliding motility-associated-like protein